MGNMNTGSDTELSLSKQRKLQREKDIKKAKKDAIIGNIIWYGIGVIIIASVIALIGYGIYRGINKVTANNEYSAELTDSGFIKDVTAADYIELCDYKNITVPASEIAYADSSVETDIETYLKNNPVLSTTTDKLAVDGDKVNIDYIGTVDGVEFEGENTKGAGSDVTIGSKGLIDTFEDQLIGHKAGDVFDVNVTFPDPYSNDPSLAGKAAVFAVTFNGIYETPELTDEYVAANLSEYASTADEYRAYVKSIKEKDNLMTWIQTYLIDNSNVKSYPKAYYKQVKALRKAEDISYFNSMNQSYYEQYGQYPYSSFENYVQMSEAKYDISLNDTAKPHVKEVLVYQAIAENENLQANEEDYKKSLEEAGYAIDNYDNIRSLYGIGYLMQQDLSKKVIEYVSTLVTVQ